MKPTKHLSPKNTAGILALFGVTLGLAFAGTPGVGVAQANDDKIFAPQFCVPINTSTGRLGNATLTPEQIEQDTQAEYQTFICPLMRDSVNEELDDVWVRLDNNNSDEDTPPICCVYSVSLGGSFVDYECETTSDSEGVRSLRLELDDFTEYDYGHYAVTCELGAEDQILSIRTSEESP